MADAAPFGSRVRERRRALDLTQEELARRVGCASVTLRKIETSRLRASRQIAERLAVALGIPLEEREAFVRAARTAPIEPAEAREPTPSRTPLLRPEEVGSDDLSGRVIRSYQLGERIGVGGFGAVYRAVQPGIEREVAIKLILPRFADHPDFIRRFESEARLVARLEHPHIVPLYDYWRDPGFAFLVMRYLRGGSLHTLLAAGSLAPGQVLQIAEQIGAALAAAHRAGVVHRDLKPSNVLLDSDGNAFLADFGIAKDLAAFATERTGVAYLGSPAYSAPEQIRAEPVTPQADIYAFGVLIYELLTGQRPFRGPTPAALMQQQLSSSLPRLAEARPGLPEALDPILQRATAKLPAARYPDLVTLLADLRAVLGDQPAEPAPGSLRATRAASPTLVLDVEDSDNPYKGLQAFDEADAENFFGRETLVHQLLSRLGEGSELARFLALIGPSGSGKSSLARAGLLPALRRGGLPGSESWYVVTLTPGARPLDELARQLRSVAPLGVEAEDLRALLGADERGLLRAARLVLPAEPQVELLLVVDQFEELFTLCPDAVERAHVLRSLVAAVLDERSRLRVILTLRGDFVDQALLDVDFGELLRQRSELVLPLTPEELERAIVGPAQRLGLVLEEGLTATMIGDVGAEPGALPLLQHTLSELFRRRNGRVLTRSAYVELGGVSGALAASAEAIYRRLTLPEQAAARQLLLRLVTPGLGVPDTRRRAGRAELVEIVGAQQLDRVSDAFGRARLLTFDHDPTSREATVEVAHETLLRAWPRLRDWIEEGREALLNERRLALATAEWEQNGREPSFLASGVRLEQFNALAADGQVTLSADERAYLAASVALRDQLQTEEEARRARELAAARALAAEQQQRADEQSRAAAQLGRRAVYLGVALALALIAVLAAGMLGNQARLSANRNAALAEENAAIATTAQAARDRAEQEARVATSRELALAAVSNLAVDAERSVLLALQALSAADTPEAQSALHQAVQASRVRLTIPHDHDVLSVEYSPDGTRLLTADGEVARVWDTATGNELFSFAAHWSWSFKFSRDGTRLASVYNDTSARIWDAATGEALLTLSGHTGFISNVALSPDGKLLVTASDDTTAKLWDLTTGEELRTLAGHTDTVNSLSFSPDGRRLVTGSQDGAPRVWDLATGQVVLTLHHPYPANAVFSPDGRWIATASYNTAQLWDAVTGEEQRTLSHPGGYVTSLGFSPDGTRLITSNQNGTVKVWDIATGEERLSFGAHSEGVEDLTVHPDGMHIATASLDNTVKVWDISPQGGREWLTLAGHTKWVYALAYGPDGTRIATASEDGTARVWDATTGEVVFTLDGHTDAVWGITFSPDGSRLATTSRDLTIRVWDAVAGTTLLTLRQPGHGDGIIGNTFQGIMDVAFHPDGRRLATAGADGTAVIWDAQSGQALRTLSNKGIGIIHLAFSPDGTRLATTSFDLDANGNVPTRVWDIDTGKELLAIDTPGIRMWGLAFNREGTQLVAGGHDSTVRVWDLTTGELLRTLSGHTGLAGAIAFSPDGRTLATGSTDTTVKLWDVEIGQEKATLSSHTDTVSSVAFSPDGTRLASASRDGTVRVYLLRIEELIALARARLTRSLTDEECRRYLHVEQCPGGP